MLERKKFLPQTCTSYRYRHRHRPHPRTRHRHRQKNRQRRVKFLDPTPRTARRRQNHRHRYRHRHRPRPSPRQRRQPSLSLATFAMAIEGDEFVNFKVFKAAMADWSITGEHMFTFRHKKPDKTRNTVPRAHADCSLRAHAAMSKDRNMVKWRW